MVFIQLCPKNPSSNYIRNYKEQIHVITFMILIWMKIFKAYISIFFMNEDGFMTMMLCPTFDNYLPYLSSNLTFPILKIYKIDDDVGWWDHGERERVDV